MTPEQPAELSAIKERLAHLESQEKSLHQSVAFIQAESKKLQLDAVKIEHGIEIGSIVIGRNGGEHRVTKILTRWGSVWVYVNPQKKDGSYSKQERCLFSDWRLPA